MPKAHWNVKNNLEFVEILIGNRMPNGDVSQTIELQFTFPNYCKCLAAWKNMSHILE